ncbi:MAG TPA: hypothetical protein VH143_20060 [Kofleriaceae bacterium]|jgi:hypothetical protein|nr:hypothetical protein [Kofleriaceae bacterium]
MKIKLVLVAMLGLAACGPALQAQPCYPAGHVIDVDGYQYVDRGVYTGAAPDDTLIPQDDPPVGDLRLGVELEQAQQEQTQPQRMFTNADAR